MVDWLAGNRVRGTSTERTTTTGFNGGFTGVGGWKEVGRTTLGSAGDTIDVSSLPDKRYYMVLNSTLNSGNHNYYMRLNGDISTNYAQRKSVNGGTDGTAVSNDFMTLTSDALTSPTFAVNYLANLSTKEKLMQGHIVKQNTAGAGTAPQREEQVGKHAQTTNPITSVNMLNTFGSSKLATGSEVVVLGWDPADTHTTNFWEELASVDMTSANSNLSSGTFTPKKYLWIQAYTKRTSTTTDSKFRMGNGSVDTGSNYSVRYSQNGTSDTTLINQNGMKLLVAGSYPTFHNIFIINNASNEKLMMAHTVEAGGGASIAPSRRNEIVGKWANTSSQADIFNIWTGSSDTFSSGIMKVWGSN